MAARYENYFQGSAEKEKEKIKRVVLAFVKTNNVSPTHPAWLPNDSALIKSGGKRRRKE